MLKVTSVHNKAKETRLTLHVSEAQRVFFLRGINQVELQLNSNDRSGMGNRPAAADALTSSSMGLVYCRAAISCSISA